MTRLIDLDGEDVLGGITEPQRVTVFGGLTGAPSNTDLTVSELRGSS
jgi:hypothetical protein